MVDAAIEQQTGAEDIVWDLSIFYDNPNDPAIQADMEVVEQQVGRIRQRLSWACG